MVISGSLGNEKRGEFVRQALSSPRPTGLWTWGVTGSCIRGRLRVVRRICHAWSRRSRNCIQAKRSSVLPIKLEH